MAKQGYPASGSRFGNHPGSAGYPATGARYGSHPNSGPATPLTILGASTIGWYRADQGLTLVTGVSQWDDISGNSRHFAQATDSAQPSYGATAGPNSTPAITFDGSDDSLQALDIDRPLPGTVPTWIWIVLKQVSWVSTRRIYSNGNSASALCLFQSAPTPGLASYNATISAVLSDLAVGAWGAVTTYFSNSVADYIQINDGTPATGVALGNNGSGTSFTIGSGANSLYSNIAIAELVFADVLPSAGQIAAMSAYRLSRYGF